MIIQKYAVLDWAILLATAAVAGEKIQLGDLAAEQEFAMHGHGDAHAVHMDTDVTIEDARKIKIVKTGDADHVTVISSGAIDDATRQQIRIIRKEVEVEVDAAN